MGVVDGAAMVFDRVDPNPIEENVSDGVAAYRSHGADIIVSVGGGSPLEPHYVLGRKLEEIEPRINRYGRRGLVFATDLKPAGRAAFERLLEATAGIGILAANLEALALEYRRVERRAKALENVLIPEVEATLKQVGEQLDILDQEEAVRVHQAARDR